MGRFRSTKVFDGFSCCFRQWKADGTHCKYIHGYGVSFKCTFEGELDEKNWVFDFGGMRRATNTIHGMTPIDYFKYLLDHTVIIADDDPYMDLFRQMQDSKIIQLRVIPDVGAEKFAEFLFNKISNFIDEETDGRVKLVELEFSENGRNSASYKP